MELESGSRWKPWVPVSVELGEGGFVRLKGKKSVEGVLLRIDAEPNGARLAFCDEVAYRRAREANIVPLASRTVRVRCQSLDTLRQHISRPAAVVPPPAAVVAPTAESRDDDLRVRDAARRLADLNGKKKKPDVDALKARLAALRGGDTSGPAFNDYSKQDWGRDDDDEDAILAWAKAQAAAAPPSDLDALVRQFAAAAAAAADDEEAEEIDVEPVPRTEVDAILQEAAKLRTEARRTLPVDDDDDNLSSTPPRSEKEDDDDNDRG